MSEMGPIRGHDGPNQSGSFFGSLFFEEHLLENPR